ncbi:ATP-grasp domain-containing protein [Sphingomonas sp. 3-13AW]|uniref:ATP-grasp domain-containing protein n=1 Tax=Sphingomonas sp. 3-13AW TaxID=3050450 RepID=UPI003BB54FA0
MDSQLLDSANGAYDFERAAGRPEASREAAFPREMIGHPMPPANVIIFTHPVDVHASSVDYVLRRTGHRPVLFDTSTVLQRDYMSVEYLDDPVVTIGSFTGKIADISASWNRRITGEKRLPSFSHPADAALIRESTNAVLAGIHALLEQGFPVNPISSARISSNKLTQLQAAKKAGFRIPQTLISNKFEDVRDFAERVGDVCMKGYYPKGWLTDEGIRHALNTKISLSDLSEPASCEIMPHIYQEYITKKAEYRVTLFAGHVGAVAIDSTKLNGPAESDWRADMAYLENLRLASLPDDVISAARRMMAHLGLRFGSLDIAETPSGEFVFFEINEQGQWLWTEEHCPDCVLLQPFCEYLASGDDRYVWNPQRRSLDLSAHVVLNEVLDNARYERLHNGDLAPTPRGGKFYDERTMSAPVSEAAQIEVA